MASFIKFFLLDCNGHEITLVCSPNESPDRNGASNRTSGWNLEIHLPHADQPGSQPGILYFGQLSSATGAPQGNTYRRLFVQTRTCIGGGGLPAAVWRGTARHAHRRPGVPT